MEGRSRSSHKYLLLQVWCGILTVAMVVMAALLISIKPKLTEGEVSTQKPENVSPTDSTVNAALLKSTGSSLSFIQLTKPSENHSWQDSPPKCPSCSLVLHQDSIHCNESSFYFVYAQVTFLKQQESNEISQKKSVLLTKNATVGQSMRRLVEGTFSNTTEGTVWVSRIVSLRGGDSINLDITGKYLVDSTLTFWGAYKLH